MKNTIDIAMGGRAVGGVGYVLRTDVERVSAEVGRWLGEDYRGRGIVTSVLSDFTETYVSLDRTHTPVRKRIQH